MKKIECVGAYSVACSFRNVDDNFVWALVSRAVVYSFWAYLHMNWCYLGTVGAFGGIMVIVG